MTQADSSQPVPVAIIGMGCLFPMANDLARFWSNIRNRLDAITDIPPTHWRPEDYWDEDPKAEDRTYARRGGFLTPVDFPLLDFGIAPHAVEATDTTQLLGLLVARQALLDAGYGPDRDFERDRVSVILGVTGTLELVIPLGARLGHPIWRRALHEAGVDGAKADEVVRRIAGSYQGWQENSFPGLLGNVAAGRIANRLNLGGTNCVVDAACASSLGAVNLALLELAAGRCDVALTGGLDTFNDIFMYMCFSKTPALSPTGDARPFDAGADGTILGEGLGILALKRLDDARRDGDRIYAVIRSMGTSSDGKGQAVYAPSAAGQVKAIRKAYSAAGVSPGSIELVEAHGTGTKVGDATELEALEGVYGGARPGESWCALGSIKSQLGHTKAAAGAAGLIKAALALHHKVLPPTIKVRQPIEPLAAGSSPFYLNTEPRPWLEVEGHPRRAAVSAFGFGGSNFHCLLEEADPQMPGIDWGGDVQILAYSASDPEKLRDALPDWNGKIAWEDIRREGARSRQRFRPDGRVRLLLVARRGGAEPTRLIEQAAARLNAWQHEKHAGVGRSPDILFGAGPPPGPLAMLFPGQGSQYVGMLRDLSCRFPAMHRALALWNGPAASTGLNLSGRIYPPSPFSDDDRRRADEALRDTRVAQPAIGAVSLGLFRVLAEFGVRPDVVAGHSFGELTALHAAGWIDESALVRLSVRRGILMADCAGSADPGAMLAVFAPLDSVSRLIKEHAFDVVIANKNAPAQCVLSGPGDEIDRAAAEFAKERVTTLRLAVSAAFHSRFVSRASGALRRELSAVELRRAALPVYANATGGLYPENHDDARDLLAGQLARPVEFVALIEAMHEAGARTFLEVGPDSKLTGLVRSILSGRDHVALAVDPSRGAEVDDNLADLAGVLANLSALGYPVELRLWDDGFQTAAPDSPRKSLTVKVCGANPSPRQVSAPPIATPPRPNDTDPPEPTMIPSTRHSQPAVNGQSSFTPPATLATVRETPAVASAPASRSATASASPAFLASAIEQSQANLLALERLAEETARLHRQFLEGQAATQRAFESLLEHQERLTLAALGQGVDSAFSRPAPTVSPAPAPEADKNGASDPAVIPAPVQTRPSANGSAIAAVTRREDEASSSGQAVAALLLDVVAEKTGYPLDTLELDLQLDADLGIDSIKRVEILSALQHRLPEAPAIKPEHLGSLQTLRQIVDFLGEPSRKTAAAESASIIAGHGRNGDLHAQPVGRLIAPSLPAVAPVLLQVVSEKTGYPPDMLELDMKLDADLGIDSIKRVEILSALQDRLPDAPAVKPEHLGTLQTLRQIADFLSQTPHLETPADPPADHTAARRNGHLHRAPHPSKASCAAAPAAEVLVQVVSEKTGYPVDMLELDMKLDVDLGIDSIKRVEILSALQDRLPEAPAVKPEHLGSLQTLRQIADFLTRSPQQVETSPTITHPVAGPAHPPWTALRCLVPQVVPFTDGAGCNPAALAPAGEIWLTDDGSLLTHAIRSRFEQLGHPVRVFRSGEWQPSVPGDDLTLAGLMILAPQGEVGSSWIKQAFRLIQAAGKALRRAGSNGGSALMTVSRLGGSFGLDGTGSLMDPSSGALAGLTKTARQEWPEVRCRAVDLPHDLLPVEKAAERILAEFLADGPEEIGLSKDVTVRVELVPLSQEAPRFGGPRRSVFTHGDLVVLSGGARGITAEVAATLAAVYQPRLVLLGRTPAPEAEPDWLASLQSDAEILRAIRDHGGGNGVPQALNEKLRLVRRQREIRFNLARIEAAGAQVSYHSVDVRNRGEVAKLLRPISMQAGPIRGLIHGAGVLADRQIFDQTESQFSQVFDTKVEGLASLLELVDRDALRFLVLFSSSSARFGRVGQIAYAAANELLNKWAGREARAHPGCRTIAFNWGPWDGGMVTETLKPMFEREGLGLIPLADGARLVVEEIGREGPRPVEMVVLADLPASSSHPEAAKVPARQGHSANGLLESVLDRQIALNDLPVLRSHVIDGHAVMPLALILEWLAEGALHRHPGMVVRGIDQLRLFKGVVLKDDMPHGVSIRAGKREGRGETQVVQVEMHGELNGGRGIVHARGDVIIGDHHVPGERTLEPPASLATWADRDEIYRQVLFHGPAMQAIQQVEGCDERAIAAWVSTSPSPSAWIERPFRQSWLTDPLAIDAAFQVMVLWTREHLGASSLPTALGSYRQFRRAFPAEGVRVLAAVRQHSEHRAVADIEFLDSKGQTVARIESYECVIDASLNQAFRRNHLPDFQVASK